MAGEIQFVDPEEYSSGKDGLTFRQIVLNHLAKISSICAKEMKSGYWQKRPIAVGGGVYPSETYIEDGRKAYINAVDFFHDILLPKFDEEIGKELEEIDKNYEKKLKEKLPDEEWIEEKLILKRKVFQKLSLLLKRLNYLESGHIEQ